MYQTYHVKIRQVSLGYKLQGVFVIEEDEQFYEKENGDPRTFKKESGAVAYLKKAAEKYSDTYQITMPNDSVRTVGYEDLEKKFGPHEWSKKNLATLQSGHSFYDIYRCRFCGKEEKAYGLNGHSRKSGYCKKNPLPKDESK